MGKERIGLYIMIILILFQSCSISSVVDSINTKVDAIEQKTHCR
jgi:hypothetical protein